MLVCETSTNNQIRFEYGGIIVQTKFDYNAMNKIFLIRCASLVREGGFAGQITTMSDNIFYTLDISERKDKYVTIKYVAENLEYSPISVFELKLKVPASEYLSMIDRL